MQQEFSDYSWKNIGFGVSAVALSTILYRWIGTPDYKRGPTPLLCGLNTNGQASALLKDGSRGCLFAKSETPIEYWFEDSKTLYESFQRGLRVSNNGPCLGTRNGDGPYEWISYQEVNDAAQALGSTLKSQMQLQRGEIVAVYAQNRTEWIITEQACNQFSLVLVPLYDTLGSEACSYILGQTEATVMIVDAEDKALKVLEAEDLPSSLNYIVITVDAASDKLQQAAAAANVQLILWNDALRDGRDNLLEVDPPSPDDTATMCYTSGTTGLPKGVIMTHRNLVGNMAGVVNTVFAPELAEMNIIQMVSPNDCYLSYLPLAHMFERCAHLLMYMSGARVGFFRGDVKLLTDDMQALQPTVFCTVPRLLNRIYDRVLAGVGASKMKQWLLFTAIQQKTKALQRGEIRRDTIWDKLVFSRVHQLTGGRVRIVITGSAPIGSKVMEFTRAAFGCPVFEGYGQTEATAAVTITMPGEPGLGHVGAPAACCVVRLADVPEMNYLASNGQGEVCVKGSNVFKGYFKQPEKTAEAFDSDGWLLTGDIGEWTQDGCLRIIDRRKHLFKLAQGEYVAPEKIEQLLTRSQFVAQIFVDGDSLEVYVVGIVVPDPEVVLPWAKSHHLPQDMQQLCGDNAAAAAQLKNVILQDITRIGRENGLKGFEICKDIHLFPDLFSVENGLLTPTFKSKRPELRLKFKPEMQQMYNRIREAEPAAK